MIFLHCEQCVMVPIIDQWYGHGLQHGFCLDLNSTIQTIQILPHNLPCYCPYYALMVWTWHSTLVWPTCILLGKSTSTFWRVCIRLKPPNCLENMRGASGAVQTLTRPPQHLDPLEGGGGIKAKRVLVGTSGCMYLFTF